MSKQYQYTFVVSVVKRKVGSPIQSTSLDPEQGCRHIKAFQVPGLLSATLRLRRRQLKRGLRYCVYDCRVQARLKLGEKN